MPTVDPTRSKFALHGPAVELVCSVPVIADEVGRLFGPFAVSRWPEGFVQTVGIIRPYDAAEVLRHVSPIARRLADAGQDGMELHQDGDRFWLVDERWGISEVNMIRGQFRSWILPNPCVDPTRCTELAVVWPLAQLLRGKGLFLLPAVSAVRDGWAVLILSPLALESEMIALIRAGYKIIGQRWTAVREEDGRLALLHLPGSCERAAVPRLRSTCGEDAQPPGGQWVDLADAFPGSWQNHAFCDAVLVATGARRACAGLTEVSDDGQAIDLLHDAWPIVELHPHRRHGQLASRMAEQTRVCEVQLPRKPQDLLGLLDALRGSAPGELANGVGAAATGRSSIVSPWANGRQPSNANAEASIAA